MVKNNVRDTKSVFRFLQFPVFPVFYSWISYLIMDDFG